MLDVIQKRKLQKQKVLKNIEVEQYQDSNKLDLRLFPGLTSILETYLDEESVEKPFLIKDGVRIIL